MRIVTTSTEQTARGKKMSVAQTILAQLGGNKFIAMTGAKNLASGSDSLQFKFSGSKAANSLQVVMGENDTYTMKFFKIRGFNFVEVATINDVYAESLKSSFESFTGLATSI